MNNVKVSKTQITIEEEGLEITATYTDGQWTVNDGYNTKVVNKWSEMLDELESITDFHSIDVDIDTLEDARVDETTEVIEGNAPTQSAVGHTSGLAVVAWYSVANQSWCGRYEGVSDTGLYGDSDTWDNKFWASAGDVINDMRQAHEDSQ